jgi:D-beta-D-heptose 7-phosphate kinase/D-beta-D-heptose 1-phosphate adenosyltransferase
MIEHHTQQQKQFKILLLGDNCTDIYRYGRVARLSPEAPVPIFEHAYEVEFAGMAGNVNENLKALGCEVTYLHTETSRKERLIDSRSKQHLIRIDRDAVCSELKLSSMTMLQINSYHAVVISDYNKGTISYNLIDQVRNAYNGVIFIDTKKDDLARFEGCFVKINSDEFSRAKTLPSGNWLIVTQGSQGAMWDGRLYLPRIVSGVLDVCGAGDTFLSALVVEYLRTKNMDKAVSYANRAAGVTVQHVGVYAPTPEEIL